MSTWDHNQGKGIPPQAPDRDERGPVRPGVSPCPGSCERHLRRDAFVPSLIATSTIPIELWPALVDLGFVSKNLRMSRRTFFQKFGPYLTPCLAPHERGRRGKLWFKTEQIRALIDEWCGASNSGDRGRDSLDPRFLANELERRFK